MSKPLSGRLKPEAQLTDGIAKRELALLGGSNAVFKFLCPMLVKPDLGEAQATEGEKARLSQRKGSVTNPSFRTLSSRGKAFLSCSSSSAGSDSRGRGLSHRRWRGEDEAALGSTLE